MSSRTEALPPWERTGSTPRQRLTELAELCEANSLRMLAACYGSGMETTGGSMYPLPVADLRALLDETCQCCTSNECSCQDE